MAGRFLTRRALLLALLGAFLAVFPFLHTWPGVSQFVTEFRTFNATMFAVWLLIVLSINLLTGYSGQISIGHAAIVLVGAFATAVLATQYSVPMPVAIAIAGVVTGLIGGVVIGVPAVRLSGPYLAIATFALVICLPQVLKLEGLTHWTHGARGIGIRELQPPGFVDGFLDNKQWLYYTTMSVAVFMTALFWNLTRSRIGRALVALRDSEIAAEQMGVNVPLYKALAFGISSFYAGIAGGLFFMVQTFVGPESMGFFESILFLVAIVIGGLGTVLGAVFGALFLTFQGEAIDKLGQLIPDAARLRGVIYGGLLIGTLLLFPRGLAGFVHVAQGWRPAQAAAWLEGVRQRLPDALARRLPDRRAEEPAAKSPPQAGPGSGGSSA